MNNIESFLKEGYENISKYEAYYILSKVFSVNKLDIALGDFKNKVDEIKLDEIIKRRLKHEPLQYILNESDFRHYSFFVDERVLIPRPETELLVDKVIDIVKINKIKAPKIVDIGTGSGAISISLALEISNSLIYSVDISKRALEVAKINMDKYSISPDKLKLIESDKLEVFKDTYIKFDILVSNPPYINEVDYLNLDKNVLDYEPKLALLDQDKEGIGFYRYFAENAYKFLNKNGFVCFEIAYHQAIIVTDILNKNDFKEIEVMKDYNSNDRIIVAKL